MSEPSQRAASAEAGQRRPADETPTPSDEGADVATRGELLPAPPPARWVSADRRRVVLEAEPAKSNLARAHCLQGAAERLRQRAAAEAGQLHRLKEEVESATGARALDAARLWFLEQSFRRRLRCHLQLVFREMHHLCEVRQHFDADAVVKGGGGPALLLLDDPSAAPAALPAAPTASAGHTPDTARKREDSNASSAADALAAADDQDVSEAEEVCAEALALGSSADSGRAAAEEVAWGGRRRPPERRFSPVQWGRDRFDRRRYKDNSSSSNGSSDSAANTGSDGQLESASAPKEAAAAPEAPAEDTLVFADADESETVAALEVFCELQRQFQRLADTLRQHALVADGVLAKAGERPLPGGGAGGRELPPQEHRQLLLHDVALLHVDLQRAQASLSRSEASLQHVVSALPPAPTMARPPPSSPLRPPRRGLAWFSTVLKKRFSRRK